MSGFFLRGRINRMRFRRLKKVWLIVFPPVEPSWLNPELKWHFSLRTLLIATTLVAVWLGLVVWMVGK